MTNEELDAKVLEAIRSGSFRASTIEALIRQSGWENGSYRDIDRSLQRLRKSNCIKYGGPGTNFSGWRVVQKSTDE